MLKYNDRDEILELKDIMITNAIQMDTVARLLVEKGIFTKEEYLCKIREVQTEYFSQMV
ncbi:MAG: hypothetical protein MUP22_08100 [Desulfobacterales bacterium]|nr:hypothetical protein [Desulfobacterales bacterium]